MGLTGGFKKFKPFKPFRRGDVRGPRTGKTQGLASMGRMGNTLHLTQRFTSLDNVACSGLEKDAQCSDAACNLRLGGN